MSFVVLVDLTLWNSPTKTWEKKTRRAHCQTTPHRISLLETRKTKKRISGRLMVKPSDRQDFGPEPDKHEFLQMKRNLHSLWVKIPILYQSELNLLLGWKRSIIHLRNYLYKCCKKNKIIHIKGSIGNNKS